MHPKRMPASVGTHNNSDLQHTDRDRALIELYIYMLKWIQENGIDHLHYSSEQR